MKKFAIILQLYDLFISALNRFGNSTFLTDL